MRKGIPISSLKLGDKVEVCFFDSGGQMVPAIVWSYPATIEIDEDGDWWFAHHNGEGGARHDKVKNGAELLLEQFKK
jgi:hypothetical protein